MGFLLFRNRDVIVKFLTSRRIVNAVGIIASVIFIGIVCLHNIELASDGVINICLRIVAAISGCTSIAIAVFVLSQSKSNKWFSIVGQNTLEIYVVHVQYIGLLPKGVHYLYSIDGILIFLAALSITVVLTAITIVIIKKVPVLNAVLFGKNESGGGKKRDQKK